MKLTKIKSSQKLVYDFDSTRDLVKLLANEACTSKEESKDEDKLIITFKTDPDFKRLKLLVILSPIFIAIFDSGTEELSFFRENLKKSNFKYGLYESFFQRFDYKTYLDFYKNHEKSEDIGLDSNYQVYFTVNPMEDEYLLGLIAMIEGLILDKKTCQYLLDYFAQMRNDIVINGRRSILANGIQAFYLSKYVVVWALDLYKIIKENRPDLYKYIEPISYLTNNLKRPGKA